MQTHLSFLQEFLKNFCVWYLVQPTKQSSFFLLKAIAKTSSLFSLGCALLMRHTITVMQQYFKLHLLEHLPGGGIFKTLYTPKLIKPYLARKAWTLAASFGSSTFTKKDNCEPSFKNIVKRIGKEVWISPVKSFFQKKKGVENLI